MNNVHQGLKAAVSFSDKFKVEALEKVKEIGVINTSELMRVPYSTLRNWINLRKGGHLCMECKKVFPYRASLRKHMVKKHSSNENLSNMTTENQEKVNS